MEEVKEIASIYLSKYKERYETAESLDDELDVEMQDLLLDEVTEFGAVLYSLEEDIFDILTDFETAEQEQAEVTIESGVGGDEAALFTYEMYQHYINYMDYMGWEYDVISEEESTNSTNSSCSLNMVQFEASGTNIYQRFLAEAGVHRVARVPINSSQIHTSTCAVKVIPKRKRTMVKLDRNDLEISSVRGSGKGGQKINTANLCAVVTHKPTGKTATFFQTSRENTLASNTERAIELLEEMFQDAWVNTSESGLSRVKAIRREKR